MQEGLEYSNEALLNKVLFANPNKDIIFFVEDRFKEFEYERIINRLFNKEISLSIIAMNGKLGVETAFTTYGSTYGDKPLVYLVDGDFDLLLEKQIIKSPNYIYLEKYNIESYFIDKEAVVNFMIGKLKKTEETVIDEIDYDSWESDTYTRLKELFIGYVVAQKVVPTEKTVGKSIFNFVDNDSGSIKQQQIDEYLEWLKMKTSEYEFLMNYYSKRYEEVLGNNPKKLICGKYILASLARYLRSKSSVNFKEDDFRYYLIGEFNINKLDFLKDRVTRILELN